MYENKTVKEIKENPSLLEGFSILYKQEFNEEFCQGCPGVLEQALLKYSNKMKFNLNPTAMSTNECSYRLNEANQMIRIGNNSNPITNANLTNAKVLELVELYPVMARTHFEMADGKPFVYPVIEKTQKPPVEKIVGLKVEKAAKEEKPVEEEKTSEALTANAPFDAAPTTLKYALDNDVDLTKVKGTGKNGRILLKDIN